MESNDKPVAWRITDGEGGYEYRSELPDAASIAWSAQYGRKWEPLFKGGGWAEREHCHMDTPAFTAQDDDAGRSCATYIKVPRQPSAEMLDAAIGAFDGFTSEFEVDTVWDAMLAAAES